MAKKRAKFWLSDIARKSAMLSRWEKRALVVASFVLGDEGHYWRKNTLPRVKAPDAELREDVANRAAPDDLANAAPRVDVENDLSRADLIEMAFARWVVSKNHGRQRDIPL
jgi:hypothetical protein